MNLLQPWNLVFAAGLVTFFAIRHPFIRSTKGLPRRIRRMDAVERVLLALMAPGTIVLPLLYLLTPWLGFADVALPWPVHLAGLLLMVLALWLFRRSHVDLGLNWSVTLEVREGHELVTRGVYARTRHPMYAAIACWSVAQGLMLDNWLAGWSMAPAVLLLCIVRIPREERLMREEFGAAYDEYSARTGRLWPRPNA